jgi:hypothetical protein
MGSTAAGGWGRKYTTAKRATPKRMKIVLFKSPGAKTLPWFLFSAELEPLPPPSKPVGLPAFPGLSELDCPGDAPAGSDDASVVI